MMTKKTSYTSITPIPSFIPRKLAIDMLQSHGEIIELNPLVTGYEAIKAPRNAPADEFYATWYEITQKIQYIKGIGKLGSGAIKFNGCFHDMPWGLQTHTYAPAGVDLRNKWQICGNQPGEPPVAQELGLGAPPEGLYLREDIEIKCNVTMISFVKKETQAASKKMVERLIKKAELLDAGVLQGMMENGKLRTHNPADRRDNKYKNSPQGSPSQPYQMPMSPMRSPTFPHQAQHGHSNSQGHAYSNSQGHVHQHSNSQGHAHHAHSNSQGYIPPQHLLGANNVVMELPGDYYHPPTSPGLLHPADRTSTPSSDSTSPNPQDARWSQASHSSTSSRPSSYASDGMRSPGLEQKAFATELPTMQETREEHDTRRQGENNEVKYAYNPQDYAVQYGQGGGKGFVHGQGGYQPHLREGWQR